MQRTLNPLVSVSVLLALAACGGGGAGADVPSSTAAAAAASVAAETTAAVAAAPSPPEASAASTDAEVAVVADAAALATAEADSIAQVAAAADSRTAARLAVAAAVRRTDPGTTTPSVGATGATDAQRIAAATATAQSTTNACSPIRPFYWEIGTQGGRVASGTLQAPGVTTKYSATMPMSIASASKWIYGAYVAQRKAGVLDATDRKHLSMLSGYTNLTTCEPTGTVDSCLATDGNGAYSAADDGKFHYDGGHMEKHASLIGLGAMNNAGLAAAVQGQLGTDVALRYSQPQLAGGLVMSPDAYATVLRKMMAGQLKMGALLGSQPVCTNPLTCGFDKATIPPIPTTESWHYSAAHWVEDDPVVGDGSFSSPGVFGFYPWIDSTKTLYGIVARMQANGGFESVQCGRLIRKAWKTAVAQ